MLTDCKITKGFCMSATSYDIVGIGNAIVDLLAQTDDAFLSRHDMRKGGMTLIDADAANRLTAEMPDGRTASGGSVANTCAVAAALGARVAFLGKVAQDPLGDAFRRDITASGRALPHQAARGRGADGALPDPGDAGRAADHEHLSRRRRRVRLERLWTRR